jgi:predicted transcriptional regulator
MDSPTLGEQELEVLRFVSDHAPASARQVVEHFAAQRGLARTTILTVLDRLRKKGYLSRKRRSGVFHDSPRVPQAEALQSLVRDFVEKTLAGSASPVVVYLARTKQLSDAEVAQLQRLVEELRAQREEEPP